MDAQSKLSSARTRMVSEQLLDRGIRDARVLAAMNRVPRERFMPLEDRSQAYADRALPIACGQTISQPYIVALMTEALELTGNERVLEIGAGSGYQAAILGELAQSVLTIERHPALARQAANLLESFGYQNVRVVEGDGTQGWPEGAPFDRIIITAATNRIPPGLWEQLAEGGLLVVPLGDFDSQMLQAIRKTAGKAVVRDLCPCRFVPLVANPPLTTTSPKVQ
jgi:protein-L-isoaspartate(D-aspartate) O-methyltransferase